jgi:hypothetical protein
LFKKSLLEASFVAVLRQLLALWSHLLNSFPSNLLCAWRTVEEDSKVLTSSHLIISARNYHSHGLAYRFGAQSSAQEPVLRVFLGVRRKDWYSNFTQGSSHLWVI